MMKVQRNKAINILIDSLYQFHEDNSVKKIQQNLKTMRPGQELTEAEVNAIFIGPSGGDWAEKTPSSGDPKHGIKGICAMIKEKMFKKVSLTK